MKQDIWMGPLTFVLTVVFVSNLGVSLMLAKSCPSARVLQIVFVGEPLKCALAH